MMHFQIDNWEPARAPTLGANRLRYAAGASMLATIFFLILGLAFRSFDALPFLLVAMSCWVIFGTASRKTRKRRADYVMVRSMVAAMRPTLNDPA